MQLYVPKAKRNTETRTKSPSKSTREVKNATASSKDTENDDELKKRLISKPVEVSIKNVNVGWLKL